MKKIFKNMAWMLAATMAMAACSDSLDESGNTGQGPLTGEGYVKVAINMPTTSGNSTRSTDNGEDGAIVDLEDGEANEYNVANAILAFFKCDKTLSDGQTPETQATFVKAYALTDTELGISDSPETPQVTEQVSVITEAPKVTANEQLYVLAILNYDSDILSVESNGVLKVNNGNLTVGTSKLSDLQQEISKPTEEITNEDWVYNFTGGSSSLARTQFTMTNAPLSDKAGTSASSISGAKAYTLVPVEVYDTEAVAASSKASKVYVERVVAKVTLRSDKLITGTQNIYVTDVNGDPTGDIVEITGWCLNVTNNSTKLVRDVTGFADKGWLSTSTDNDNSAGRFAGTRAINASFGVDGESNYYRIYWAQDCNYDATTAVGEDFTTYHNDGATTSVVPTAWNTKLATSTADNACYCLENTMDYQQQMQNRTTGVLIQTNYLTKFGAEEGPSAKSFFICGTTSTKHPEVAVGGVASFVDYVMTEANKLLTDGYKFGTNELSLKGGLESGTYTDIDEVFTFSSTDKELAAQKEAVNNVVGGRISYYKDAKNYYYSSLIRHFQDGEGVDLDGAVGVASANEYTLKHLGRYGVVRNNWYDININSIGGPGVPVIIEPGDDPDDEVEGYINCTINVLSWAKRSQNVDL